MEWLLSGQLSRYQGSDEGLREDYLKHIDATGEPFVEAIFTDKENAYIARRERKSTRKTSLRVRIASDTKWLPEHDAEAILRRIDPGPIPWPREFARFFPRLYFLPHTRSTNDSGVRNFWSSKALWKTGTHHWSREVCPTDRSPAPGGTKAEWSTDCRTGKSRYCFGSRWEITWRVWGCSSRSGVSIFSERISRRLDFEWICSASKSCSASLEG